LKKSHPYLYTIIKVQIRNKLCVGSCANKVESLKSIPDCRVFVFSSAVLTLSKLPLDAALNFLGAVALWQTKVVNNFLINPGKGHIRPRCKAAISQHTPNKIGIKGHLFRLKLNRFGQGYKIFVTTPRKEKVQQFYCTLFTEWFFSFCPISSANQPLVASRSNNFGVVLKGDFVGFFFWG
jgi:hypothetical protein